MDCDGQVAAHLARSLTDWLLEPYLPRRRLGNWARGGTEADESGIQDTERRVSQVAQVEVEDLDRSPAGGCSTRKCLRFENQYGVCTEKPRELRVGTCTGWSRQRQQQQKSGLQLVVQIFVPPRLDTENSNLTACNQRRACP